MNTIPIPKGTNPSVCRSCQAAIFFAPHPSTGRPTPVAIDTMKEVQKVFPPGTGIAVFTFDVDKAPGGFGWIANGRRSDLMRRPPRVDQNPTRPELNR